MADADILKSLREQVLDESESLVGLLRKCLALGALTGSDELRTWASNELKGYGEEGEIPSYRSISAPLYIDTVSGPTYAQGQQINHLQIPSDLRKHVPESVNFTQPVEELMRMAEPPNGKAHKIGYEVFSLVVARWSADLPMFQEVSALYYLVPRASVAGIVGMVRTTLVEIVIDLAKDVPLDSLPSRAKVDSVVQVHVRSNDKYEVNIGGSNSGNIGQGTNFVQNQNNTVPTELTALIGQMRAVLSQVDDDDQRADVEQAIADFDDALSEDEPKPEKIKRRWRALERIATALGSAALTEAVKDVVPMLAQHFHVLV